MNFGGVEPDGKPTLVCRYVCGVGSRIPTRSADGVIVWLANPDVKHFVRDKFGALPQTAVEQIAAKDCLQPK